MKNRRVISIITITVICASFLTGCWNYREVEKLAIVSGVAIDKDGKDKLRVTVEIVNVQQDQKQATNKPVYIQAVGKTFFDAVRSMVAIQGKKLYWSHAKAAIIGEDVTNEGITDILDFLNRDAEVRSDMWVFISRERNARDIFNSKPIFERVISFELDDTMRAQKAVSRYPAIELYEFLDNIASKETASLIPTVKLITVEGTIASYVTGSAIVIKDKLLGYLGETDTRSLLWVQDELKGGVYPVVNAGNTQINVSLEIFRSRTKIKPEVKDGVPTIKVQITTDANIGEIMGNKDFISNDRNRALLIKDAEAQIKKDIENVIEKAQKEYKVDFLGFGENIKRSMPSAWKRIEKDWKEIFPDIETQVDVHVRIRGSATTSKPIKVGM